MGATDLSTLGKAKATILLNHKEGGGAPQKKSASPPPGAGSNGAAAKDFPGKDGGSQASNKYNTEVPTNRRKEQLLEVIKATNISSGKPSEPQTDAGGAATAGVAGG